MSAHALIAEIQGRIERGDELDWRKLHENIHDEHQNARSSEERSLLIGLYMIVMDQLEKTSVEPENIAKFREARGQDYNLFLVAKPLGLTVTSLPSCLTR